MTCWPSSCQRSEDNSTELLIGSSLIAAFVAGVAALFAPCCITVLLPAYLASIFRQRRTVFLMTFVFFLGLLVVFLPLGVGVAGLGQLLTEYHDAIFITCSLFLILLGVSILLGRHFSLPFSVSHNTQITGAASVFVLGVFSGLTTLCCAPVLAGVIALSVLPGSLFWGGVYSLAYVLGMVVPLFALAFFVDKANMTERMRLLRKRIVYSLAGKQVNLAVTDVVSGTTFLVMGVFILYSALTGQLAMDAGGYQTSINIFLANVTDFVSQYLGRISAVVSIAALAVVLFLIVRMVVKRMR